MERATNVDSRSVGQGGAGSAHACAMQRNAMQCNGCSTAAPRNLLFSALAWQMPPVATVAASSSSWRLQRSGGHVTLVMVMTMLVGPCLT